MFTQNELYYACRVYKECIDDETVLVDQYRSFLLREMWRYLRERQFLRNNHPMFKRYLEVYQESSKEYTLDKQLGRAEELLLMYVEYFWERTTVVLTDAGYLTKAGRSSVTNMINLMEDLGYDKPGTCVHMYRCADSAFVEGDCEDGEILFMDKFDAYEDYYQIKRLKRKGEVLPKHRLSRDFQIGRVIMHGAPGLFTDNVLNARATFSCEEDLRFRAYLEACELRYYTVDVNCYPRMVMNTDAESALYQRWHNPADDFVTRSMIDDWRREAVDNVRSSAGVSNMNLE